MRDAQDGNKYWPRAEILWKVDPNMDAARKLKDWARFHRVCGQSGVYFDSIERQGRMYHCVAFSLRKVDQDLFNAIKLCEGTGRTILDALSDALSKCGRSIPEAEHMISLGLTGEDFTDLLG